MPVPKAMRDKYEAIAPLIANFCGDHLNDEYEALCMRLLEKLCRKRPSPLLSGREATWAAGIVYAICTNNFIFDKNNPYCMTAKDIADGFGLSASTAGNKASQIKKMFDIKYVDAQWVLPNYLENNPVFWMLELTGRRVDARMLPPDIQQLAFERGLIPFVPEKENGKG